MVPDSTAQSLSEDLCPQREMPPPPFNTHFSREKSSTLIPNLELIPEWQPWLGKIWVFLCQRAEKPSRECLLWVLVMVSEQARWTKSLNKGFWGLEKKEEIPNKWNNYKTNTSKVKSIYHVVDILISLMWCLFCFYIRQKRGGTCFPFSLSARNGHA